MGQWAGYGFRNVLAVSTSDKVHSEFKTFFCLFRFTNILVSPFHLASFPGRKNERPGTHCMRMRSIPQNLGNPVNYCSFSRLKNEASLDARLPSILTNVKIEGGRGDRPGSKPPYVTQRQQTFMAFVYLLRVCFRIPI